MYFEFMLIPSVFSFSELFLDVHDWETRRPFQKKANKCITAVSPDVKEKQNKGKIYWLERIFSEC